MTSPTRHPTLRRALAAGGVLVAAAVSARCVPDRPATSQAVSADSAGTESRALHDRLLVLDTHVDIDPDDFSPGALNYAERLNTQVDLTKMEAGGVDAVFFSVYVPQGELTPAGYARAYAADTAKFNAVHRLAEVIAPSRISIAHSADEAERIVAEGRKAAFLGVENGYGIGTDLARVAEFYERGARYMSLAHNGHSQLADSNTGEATDTWAWHGLSPLGRRVIAEMNRLGMMIDVSHPSKEAAMQMLAISTAPIIASHSAVRALCDHSRNLDDEALRAIAAAGGVIQVVAFNSYLKCDTAGAERSKQLAALDQEFGFPRAAPAAERGGPVAGLPGTTCTVVPPARSVPGAAPDSQVAALPEATRREYLRRREEILQRLPLPARATVADLADHIDYVVKLVGVDHVGISSDFDGGGGIEGFRCALEAPNVTAELLKRGYSEPDLGKIWGGNLLRVLREVEKAAGKS